MANLIRANEKMFETLDIKTERNSGGRLDKIWVRDIKTTTLYLIKTSTYLGYEPFSEVMAYIIGKALGLNVLKYELLESKYFKNILKNGVLCNYFSICPAIESADYEIVSIAHLKNLHNLTCIQKERLNNKEIMEKVLSKEAIDKLLLFDAIIGNKDRHYRNVHVLRNSKGNILESIILDNGDSLLATNILGSIGKIGSYTENKLNKSATLNNTHDKQVEYITTINTQGINTEELVSNVLKEIKPILALMPIGRALAIRHYVKYRIKKYYTLFGAS